MRIKVINISEVDNHQSLSTGFMSKTKSINGYTQSYPQYPQKFKVYPPCQGWKSVLSVLIKNV